MPDFIGLRGADRFEALAKRLKDADKEIQKEFTSALARATKPMKLAAKASAASRLPQRGGLAARVARARLSTRRKTRGKKVGIVIVASGMPSLDLMDQGTVRHRVFGKGPWVTQKITPGWFTEPMEKSLPIVRKEITAAMDDIAKKIEG